MSQQIITDVVQLKNGSLLKHCIGEFLKDPENKDSFGGVI